MSKTSAVLATLLLPSLSLAAEWQGSGELGATLTSGNSNTESWNGRVALSREGEVWRTGVALEALKASNEGVNSAERYIADLKLDYKINSYYGFGSLRNEDDRFSGYDYQRSIAGGMGIRIWDGSDGRLLDLSAGVGEKYSKQTTTGAVEESNEIMQLTGLLNYPLNEQVTFGENLLIEAGKDNTSTSSITSLAISMNSHLAAKFSYTLKHNTQVPAGIENSDSITTVSLMYTI